MLKLYRLFEVEKEYWETWDNDDGTHTVHWGELGTKGQQKTIKKSLLKSPTKIIQKEIDTLISKGFSPIDIDDHKVLLIEHIVEGMGSENDLQKRHLLEDRMNETLGWTGLGHCDGGSIGSGTMEVCSFVVDFELAKKTIEKNLENTEFADYSRIYEE